MFASVSEDKISVPSTYIGWITGSDALFWLWQLIYVTVHTCACTHTTHTKYLKESISIVRELVNFEKGCSVSSMLKKRALD